ncbi:MAG: radical SAM protein [Gammaproteobacteria bacterium]|nr:radical SAM protein [Gammaproteobacteria bacterium]
MDSLYRLIRLNRRLKSPRLKYAFVLLADLIGIRHLFVRFDPVNACNLKCGMCYFSDREYVKRTKGIFRPAEIERIAEMFLPRAVQFMIGCGTEPTLYKDFTDLVRLGKSYGVPYVGFTTNAQRLTEDHVEDFVRYGLDEITLSLHGVHKKTYEDLMVNASYERFHEALEAVRVVRLRHDSDKPYLRVNYTVNKDNLEEMADFFTVFGKYGIRTLQLRPMVDVGDTSYKFENFEPLIPRYNEIVAQLEKECRERGIIFLATTEDPTYEADNQSSEILDAVLRYMNPQVVWKEDFDWRKETYRQYGRRTHWRRSLLKAIFSRNSEFRDLRQHLTYDVKL